MSRTDKAWRAKLEALPPFSDDPVQRLRHTLAACGDAPDDEWAITATGGSGDVLGYDRTGLTWGDLRALLARIES